jgi:hypothetical protein
MKNTNYGTRQVKQTYIVVFYEKAIKGTRGNYSEVGNKEAGLNEKRRLKKEHNVESTRRLRAVKYFISILKLKTNTKLHSDLHSSAR